MNKCSHGAEILKELGNHNIKPKTIIMERRPQTIKRRIKRIYKNIFGHWWEKDSFYTQFASVASTGMSGLLHHTHKSIKIGVGCTLRF